VTQPNSPPPNSAPAPPSQPSQAPPVAAPPSPPSPPAATAASSPGQGFNPQPPAAQQQAALPAPVMPAYTPAQPDVSVKYHVLLGLPQASPGDGFDAPATQKADVGTDSIAEFRRHLKTCAKLPREVAPSDRVTIKLRVQMTPEGRLAATPTVIGGSASIKGPLLMQSAISALEACQPYGMLPADRYKEWRILDLNFTPEDFESAS
jgi:hypothetical protein